MNFHQEKSQQQFLGGLKALVEKHLHQVTTRFEALDNEMLGKPSASGGWSIAQCLDHLNSYGQYYLPLLINHINLNVPTTDHLIKHGWLGSYFIKMMDPEINKAKYTAAKKHMPQHQIDPKKILTTFIAQQHALLQILKDAAEVDLNKKRIPISISQMVKLRTSDVLAFLIVHNERHLRQAGRNLG